MVLDKRAHKLAEIVVDYCVDIQEDDVLLIQAEDSFEEFVDLIDYTASEKGAEVTLNYFNLVKRRELIERNDNEELKRESKTRCGLVEGATAVIGVHAKTDPFYLEGIDPKKYANFASLYEAPFAQRVAGDGKEFKEKKWNKVAFPSEADAKKAGMSLEEYADFVYSATNIDWLKKRKEMEIVKEIFDNAKDVHILVPGKTDLHFSLDGRGGRIFDGKFNMPDGEVYYGPVENSANGKIYFPYATEREGNIVSGIELEYRDGEVVSFKAEKNKEFLESMLNLKGAKKIGEFGIGCNYMIERYIQNLLFDEKIGGTVHIALGRSYKTPINNGGGLNDGEIHMDLVCDLRKINNLPGGRISVDGNVVQENGIWCF